MSKHFLVATETGFCSLRGFLIVGGLEAIRRCGLRQQWVTTAHIDRVFLQGLHGDLEHPEVCKQGQEHQEQGDRQPGQDFEDDPDVAEGDPEPAV